MHKICIFMRRKNLYLSRKVVYDKKNGMYVRLLFI